MSVISTTLVISQACRVCGSVMSSSGTWIGGLGPYCPGCIPELMVLLSRKKCPKCGHEWHEAPLDAKNETARGEA